MREARCKNLPVACPVMPRSRRARVHPSQEVARAAFALPGTLPAGLAEQLEGRAQCQWVGVATATVDRAGRVRSIDLKNLPTTCPGILDTIVKLSYATNTSLASDTTSNNILLVKARKAPLCLDEPLETFGGPAAMGSSRDMTAPVIRKRVEPFFPESARHSMGRNSSVLVVVESVISQTGCV